MAAESNNGLVLRDEEFCFVLGMVKTSQWFLGSYLGPDDAERGVQVYCTISNIFDASCKVRVTRHEGQTPIFHDYYPLPPPPPAAGAATAPAADAATSPMVKNQCIFVHFAKLKRRPAVKRALDKLKVRAGFSEKSETRDNDRSVSGRPGAQPGASQSDPSVTGNWDVKIYPPQNRVSFSRCYRGNNGQCSITGYVAAGCRRCPPRLRVRGMTHVFCIVLLLSTRPLAGEARGGHSYSIESRCYRAIQGLR